MRERLAELDISHPDLQLDKTVGEGGGRLSGGQQQRVNLARAMLKRGTIYLLDEPTTGLDNAVARSLQKTLDKLAENATTICATCVEIKFQAPHAIDATLSPELHLLDGVEQTKRTG